MDNGSVGESAVGLLYSVLFCYANNMIDPACKIYLLDSHLTIEIIEFNIGSNSSIFS